MTQLEIMDTIRREIREKGISQAEFSKMLGYGPQKFETDYYRVRHGRTICKSSLEMYLSFIGFKLSIEREETPDIVRCKDCKHAVLTSKGEAKYCQFWQEDEEGNFGGDPLYLDGNFFCAGGERR